MPQTFQVLRCYKCSVFQVHLMIKSNKWNCKMCGEKQSVKRFYGLGTAKECRFQVIKLNGMRGELDEAKNNTDDDSDSSSSKNEEIDWAIEAGKDTKEPIKHSRWSQYLEESGSVESNTNTNSQRGKEVDFEVPKELITLNAVKRETGPVETNDNTTNSGCEEMVVKREMGTVESNDNTNSSGCEEMVVKCEMESVEVNDNTNSSGCEEVVENCEMGPLKSNDNTNSSECEEVVMKCETGSVEVKTTNSPGCAELVVKSEMKPLEENFYTNSLGCEERAVKCEMGSVEVNSNTNSPGCEEVVFEIPKKLRKLNAVKCEMGPVEENTNTNSLGCEEVVFEIPKKLRKLNTSNFKTNTTFSTFDHEIKHENYEVSPVMPNVINVANTESKTPLPSFNFKAYHPEQTFNKMKLNKKFVPPVSNKKSKWAQYTTPDLTDQSSLLPPFENLDGLCSDSMMAKPFTWSDDTNDLDPLNI